MKVRRASTHPWRISAASLGLLRSRSPRPTVQHAISVLAAKSQEGVMRTRIIRGVRPCGGVKPGAALRGSMPSSLAARGTQALDPLAFVWG